MKLSRQRLLLLMKNQFSLPYSLDFAQFGALPADWVGVGAAISGGRLVITPTISGDELLTDGGLEAWTSATNLTNWTEGKTGTSTINQEGTIKHGGSNALRLDIDASSSYAYINQAITATTGRWAKAVYWLYTLAVTKSGKITIGALSCVSHGTEAVWTQFTDTLKVAADNPLFGANRSGGSASSSLYYDDLSCKLLVTSSMFAYKNRIIQNVGSVKAGWHIVAGNPAGVFGWWDGVTAEQNCLVAHRDGTNATLVKYVGATRTEVIAPTAVTYVAGRSIEIRRLSGTNTFQLFYNGTQVGANQTISDPEIINNGYFGTFSSYEGNQCVSFVVNPFAAATLDYTFIDDPLSDYVVEVGIESSLILDGNQLDMWYHHGAVTEYIYSTDPTMQTWSAPVQVLSGYYYPYVTRHPVSGVYYMIACNSQATQGDLYMFSSPDKTTWTIMNSGNPVLTHNPSTASLFYNLLNPSILFVEDALYLAIEGRDAVGGWYGMGLASSTLVAGPSFDASLTQIIPVSGMAVNVIGGCNPDLHYLSNRGVFVLVGTVWVADYLNTAIWFASDDDNLFDGNSWTKTKFSFAHSGKYTTDPYLIELPAFFNHRLLLSYNYDQLATNSLRQAFNETTLTELYDALVKNL